MRKYAGGLQKAAARNKRRTQAQPCCIYPLTADKESMTSASASRSFWITRSREEAGRKAEALHGSGRTGTRRTDAKTMQSRREDILHCRPERESRHRAGVPGRYHGRSWRSVPAYSFNSKPRSNAPRMQEGCRRKDQVGHTATDPGT